MTAKEILNHLAALNPNARIWTEFDEALIGIAARPLQSPVAVYSLELIIAGVMKRENTDRDTASLAVQKYFLRDDMGKGAPVILIEALSKDYRIGLGQVEEEKPKIILPGEPGGGS